MKRIRRKYSLIFAIAILIILAVFLVPGHAKQPPKGHVVYAHSSTFYQIGGDPATHAAGFPILNQTMHDNLVQKDIEQKLLPALATRWSVAPDWSYIDFYLRDDVKFHNGAPVTPEDIKYSIETHMRPELKWVLGTAFRHRLGKIEVRSPTKLRLNLKDAFPGLWGRLWWGTGVFPKAYREKLGDQGFAENPVGAGPFKWANDWKQDVYFRVEAVPDHYRKPPEIDSLTILYVQEHSTRLAMLKAGEADIIELIGPLIPQVDSDPELRVLLNKHTYGTTIAFTDLAFPDKPSPFHDIRVREAASLAIDRKTICEKILFGTADPYGGVLTPITLGYDPKDVVPDPYDPERAKALLAQAGYPDGFETIIHATAGSKYYLEAIAANLTDIGINASVKVWERGAYFDAWRNKRLPGIVSSGAWHNAERWSGLADHWYSPAMWCYHSTPEIDKAIDEGMYAITDQETADAGRKIQALIKKSRIKAILWSSHQAFGVGPRIAYWRPSIGANPGVNFEFLKLKD